VQQGLPTHGTTSSIKVYIIIWSRPHDTVLDA
jgi:hypothetical protein